ncbi:hypothetical protein E4U41_007654, partial [Claviceps citrina]
MDARQVHARPNDVDDTCIAAVSSSDDDGPCGGGGGGGGGGGLDLEKKTTARPSTPHDDEADDEADSFPEGGLQAWLVVLGSWFGLISSIGLMNTIAVLQAYTASHQLKGRSEGTVGWIFSLYTFLAFFCGVYIGPVFDKHGPRWLMVSGCAINVTGVLCMSFSSQLWQLTLSFGVLCGLGSSLVFTPSVAAVGHWFRRRRGFATGMASTAGGIGGI